MKEGVKYSYTKFITYAIYAIYPYSAIGSVHSVGNTVYARACEAVFSPALPNQFIPRRTYAC